MSIQIYDAQNFFRRLLEVGGDPRSIFNEFISAVDEQRYVIWDGPHALKARRDIYPEYKAQRVKPKTDIYVNFDTLREVLKFTPAVQVRVPGYEADDVIASLARIHGDECYIHSTDADFLALGVPCGAKPIEGVKPEHIRLYKTFVGDPSDNIPGCPGFGKKAWDEADPAGLYNWLHCDGDYEFPKRAKPDREQLLKFWKITGFLPVEMTAEHVTVGKMDWDGGSKFLNEWMM